MKEPQSSPQELPKTALSSTPKSPVKTMAKTMAKSIATVPVDSPVGMPPPSGENPRAEGAGQTAGQRSSQAAGKSKAVKSAVSLRQVWAAQQQKRHLHVQVERFNQQINPPQAKQSQAHQSQAHQSQGALGRSPQSPVTSISPSLPVRGPHPNAGSAAPAAVVPEDAQAAWETAQALRTLSGRPGQTLTAPARATTFASGGAPAICSPPLTPGRIRRPRPLTLKSALRKGLRWGLGLLRQGFQGQSQSQNRRPRQGQNQESNQGVKEAVLWIGGAAIARWGSQFLLAAVPGLAAVLGVGLVLSAIAATYLAWQSRAGVLILYRLLLLLLGFWLGGRF